MQSGLLGLLITAILVSPAPRAPAESSPGAAHAAWTRDQEREIALRRYQLEKSRCRTTAGSAEPTCIRQARLQYRAARAGSRASGEPERAP